MTVIDTSKLVTKKEIINLLKEQLSKENVESSHIGLPRDMDFSSQNGIMNVHLTNTVLNMQTNGAAFEGWIIALKTSLPYITRKVEFEFPAALLTKRLGNPEACHYNRFLYRLANFERLFPDWFSLDTKSQGKVTEFQLWLKQEPCFLNHSLRERGPVFETENMERKIESWLVFSKEGSELLCECWGLDQTKLFNQLPVGVFHKKIERGNAIFTRGAGAIDLWGISKDRTTLHIIELKCGRNIKMGVISEMLFYTAVMYDTCIAEDNLFHFGKYGNSPPTRDTIAIQNGGQKFKQLHSHILAEHYHPLFSDGVVNLLKAGLSRLDIKFDRAQYDYTNKRKAWVGCDVA